MKNGQLDSIDKEILRILQKDARTPLKEIAESVYLTAPAVSARIEKLEKEEYILNYRAIVNPLKLGYPIKAFINLAINPVAKKEFYPYIKECENVIECNCVTGDYGMLIEVQFESMQKLDLFINELLAYGNTQTLIVFSTAVEQRGIRILD